MSSRAIESNIGLNAWTDEELLLEYRSTGDRKMFNELVSRFEGELYGYLRRYLGDSHDADDVFQQTWLQIHLKCEKFEPGRKSTSMALYGGNESGN